MRSLNIYRSFVSTWRCRRNLSKLNIINYKKYNNPVRTRVCVATLPNIILNSLKLYEIKSFRYDNFVSPIRSFILAVDASEI